MGHLKLSIIVPAFNEEKLIVSALAAVRESVSAAGFTDSQWELRVCDNASDDATAQLAAAAGAVVVHEPQRQIARARNAAAAGASGEWLLFVDADTWPSRQLLVATRQLMESATCCGGGAVIDGRALPIFTRSLVGLWNTLSRTAGLACGAYVFCRRSAFVELGGFSTELYAAEELDLSWRWRKWGRIHGQKMVIIASARLATSMRKLELYSPKELWAMGMRGLLHPTRVLKSRQFLDHWYDGRR